ncbi:hypothetical protein DYB37_005181 [Aphanomyces astaci]|uniref:Peptidase M13 C-terminal domain-containing protein n=1 Tax=Aphanomyces astaci TaxID=112090 RepID=A0A3R7A609_APHAT|nr:hypothetical protein DYB35_007541 [Aphanomyces astaci]RHZ18930.1 hypothetical protein DYB37_005181 [Aphanomyces astaci]
MTKTERISFSTTSHQQEVSVYGTASPMDNEDLPRVVLRSRNILSKLAVVGGSLLIMGCLAVVGHSLPRSSTPSVKAASVKPPASKGDPFAAFRKDSRAFLDESVDPCHNFYQYACGGWLETATIPDDATSVDTSFSVVAAANTKIIDDIMTRRPPLIDPLYQSCLGGKDVDPRAIEAISLKLEHLASLTSVADVVAYAGHLYAVTGAVSLFSLDVGADAKNASSNVLTVGQGGLTFPVKEYYTDSHKRSKYFSLFVTYAQALGHVKAFPNRNVSQFAHRILNLEASFANVSESSAALRDPWALYNPVAVADLPSKFPYVTKYLQGAGIYQRLVDTNATVVVEVPSFLTSQAALLESLTDLQILKSYVGFHLLDAQSQILGESFRQASHNFHGTLRGLVRKQVRKDFCFTLTQSLLGDVVGQYYMDQVWDTQTKEAAKRLVQEIESSMDGILQREAWLDEATRAQAMTKLHQVFNLVGGPDDGAVPSLPFNISATDFWSNVMHFKGVAFQATLDGIGAPVDRNGWGMTASTVNAYYEPSENKMVFPAAIMQQPFYSARKLPDVANYARIGMVMGHELTHGFDDEGRNFDSQGNMHVWWSANVSHTYDVKAKCLADQYSTFDVLTLDQTKLIGYVDGQLTLGENIADNGGLKLAYLAYLNSKHGATEVETPAEKQADAQAYFVAFAQGWCGKHTDSYAELLLASDPHSPNKWRVNGPIMNSQTFADAFQCPVGAPMNPAKKCIVW